MIATGNASTVGGNAANQPRGPRLRRRPIAFVLLAMAMLLGAKSWWDTMAEPRLRRAAITLAALPQGSDPIRVALMSDIHVAGPDMSPGRLASIVQRVNALHPDLVLIAGDFVSDKDTATHIYSTAQAIAPLAGLRPQLATVAVLGNHDHWRDAGEVTRELTRLGVAVLVNEARRFGPLAIGGLDDDFTGHADLPATLDALRKAGGIPILLSHSPDPFPEVPRPIGVMVAGHTHCGQLRYPWGGSPATMSRYGDRYACGMVREDGKVLVTTGGLGTSVLPIRFGTRPEIWLIDLRPRT